MLCACFENKFTDGDTPRSVSSRGILSSEPSFEWFDVYLPFYFDLVSNKTSLGVTSVRHIWERPWSRIFRSITQRKLYVVSWTTSFWSTITFVIWTVVWFYQRTRWIITYLLIWLKICLHVVNCLWILTFDRFYSSYHEAIGMTIKYTGDIIFISWFKILVNIETHWWIIWRPLKFRK